MTTTQEQIHHARKQFHKMVANPTLCWLCLDRDAFEPTLGLCSECRAKLKGTGQ